MLERRTRIVAKVVSNYLKKHDLRFDKAIFFCVDTEHADRMWQALINENQDLVNQDERYIMRITGDDPIGKKQLKNFQDVSSRCPTLVTTSKLLTTGVDAQMVRFIVLDSNINSMTEFNQIISRDTRVRDAPANKTSRLHQMLKVIFLILIVTLSIYRRITLMKIILQISQMNPHPSGE